MSECQNCADYKAAISKMRQLHKEKLEVLAKYASECAAVEVDTSKQMAEKNAHHYAALHRGASEAYGKMQKMIEQAIGKATTG